MAAIEYPAQRIVLGRWALKLERLVDHIARRAAVRGIPIHDMILRGELYSCGGSI